MFRVDREAWIEIDSVGRHQWGWRLRDRDGKTIKRLTGRHGNRAAAFEYEPGADDHGGSDVEQRGTVTTISAEDHDTDAPAKELTVSAAVTVGADGTGGAGVADTDDHGRRNGADGDAEAGSDVDLEGRRREHRDGDAGSSDERNVVTLTVSTTAVSPAVAGDFELSANQVLTITAGQTSSNGGR